MMWREHAMMARVYIQQYRARINNPAQKRFRFVLMQWAAGRRIQALNAIRESRIPKQQELQL